MNRRELLQATSAAALAASLPLQLTASTNPGAGPATIETEIKRLKLRHTWTTTMSSSEYRDVIYCRYTRGGITGVGEGAPIVRYKEDAKSAQRAIESVRDFVSATDPWQFDAVMREVNRRVPGEHAAKAALDIALLDWVSKRLGIPLYRLFGLNASEAPITTFSIGVDTPEITRQKVDEAAAFPVLKIKMGIGKDEDTLAAIRAVTRKPLRIDANEGWRTKEEALRKIQWLEKDGGIEFVEQPMPAEQIDDVAWVRRQVKMTLIADEACTGAALIPRLQSAYDGINVKLDKAGGVLEAHRWISIAKALGMKTMLGCMVSSSVSVTAAAHLSPLVDYADLDGNLLIANDAYSGVTVKDGKLVLPDQPGLGLKDA